MLKSKFRLSYCLIVAILIGFTMQTAAQAYPFFEAGTEMGLKHSPHLKKISFQVLSANCASCVNAMTQMIGGRPGIKYVKVDMMKPKGALADVIYDDTVAAQEDVMDVVHHFHFSEADVKISTYKPPVVVPFRALPFMPKSQASKKQNKSE